MFDFGDELILQSFRIPWLLWIQLIIVFLLLLAFLFCFTIFASSDPSSPDIVAAASASTIQPLPNNHSTVITNALHSTRGVDNLSIKGEIVARSASRGIVREEIAVAAEGEASSSLYFLHPCYYFKLARVAFLKCLGLDSSSESDENPPPPTQKHMKRKES